MLTEYVHDHDHELGIDRELREISQSRPRYERAASRDRSRLRNLVRSFAMPAVEATPGAAGGLPDVVIRPAGAADARALMRLAEASERRVPSGLILVAEVDAQVVAALPIHDSYVLADLWRRTGDVVQLLELRSAQLRAARLEKVA